MNDQISVDDMRAWLLSAPDAAAATDSYDDTARLAAKWVYQHLQAHPEHQACDANDLYSHVRVELPAIAELGLTATMWGFAVNAARHCLDLAAVDNPALLIVADGEP